jgi:hypothetical protein
MSGVLTCFRRWCRSETPTHRPGCRGGMPVRAGRRGSGRSGAPGALPAPGPTAPSISATFPYAGIPLATPAQGVFENPANVLTFAISNRRGSRFRPGRLEPERAGNVERLGGGRGPGTSGVAGIGLGRNAAADPGGARVRRSRLRSRALQRRVVPSQTIGKLSTSSRELVPISGSRGRRGLHGPCEPGAPG